MKNPFSTNIIRTRYQQILGHNSNGESGIIVGLPFSGRMGFLKAYNTNYGDDLSSNFPDLELFFLTPEGLELNIQSSKKPIQVINVTGITKNNVKKVIDYYLLKLKAKWEEEHRAVINIFLDPDCYLFIDEFKELISLCTNTFFFKSLNSDELSDVKKYYEEISDRKIRKSHNEDVANKLLHHYYLMKLYYLNNDSISESLVEVFNRISDSLDQTLSIKNSRTDALLSNLGITRADYNKSVNFVLTSKAVLKLPILNLNHKEKAFIKILKSGTGEISKESISKILWGSQSCQMYSEWAIQKFVSRIRTKITSTTGEDIISIRGIGYKLISVADDR